ncbi:MAG TPA: CDP-diacylglycerol--glycerol-3-phosphate 3-phosphatidyltransferase [Candidatus Nanoarchaeia archaeon]|nr:CDP-diacylglycerol--glycerol-3-phosphate 3-phosphatidyltransferase [Candidatus Nanoarchaeia archaeon]
MKFKFNIPNKITLIRISLIPLFAVILLAEIPYRNILAAFIFGMLSISDFFDGYIARKKKQVTEFGKLIDPIADKFLISTALIFLIGRGVELWMAVVIISREVVLTAIRIYLLPSKLIVPASNFGKAKTVVQSIAIVAVLLELRFSYYIMLAAVLLTLISGIEYLFRIRRLTGNKIVNLPNLITLARFLLIIPFIYYVLRSKIYVAIIIFAMITLSDKLDGISARLMNQRTELGSFFDSFTDWAFISATVIMFVYKEYLSFIIGIMFLVPLLLGALIKIYYFKKCKKILTSTISVMTVGSSYISTLALLIDFAYKGFFVIATLILCYAALLTFAFKTLIQDS